MNINKKMKALQDKAEAIRQTGKQMHQQYNDLGADYAETGKTIADEYTAKAKQVANVFKDEDGV